MPMVTKCHTVVRCIHSVEPGSTPVIPLRGENNRVMGTIALRGEKPSVQFYQSHVRRGDCATLSAQILAGQYERQKAL
jgi:two-component system LytT family sensor kinase